MTRQIHAFMKDARNVNDIARGCAIQNEVASASAFPRYVGRSELWENIVARFAAGYARAGLEGCERFDEGDPIDLELALAKHL